MGGFVWLGVGKGWLENDYELVKIWPLKSSFMTNEYIKIARSAQMTYFETDSTSSVEITRPGALI